MNAAAAPAGQQEFSAGIYIRRRREAAGLSVEAVAVICTSSPVELAAAIAAIEDAEADRVELDHADLQRLRGAFRFAPMVYRALAQGISASEICHGCGCTQWDPCEHPVTRLGCGWADEAHALCTVCRDKVL